MNTRYATLSALLLVLGSAGAMAQMGDSGMGGDSGGSLFESLDANGDGALDRDEAAAGGLSGTAFTEADSDGDGVISRGEYDKLRNPGAGPQ